MAVWLRRTLVALAALALVAIATAAWLISTFDPVRYKDLAIEWVKTHRDRTLAIDGPIKLSVFPRLEVHLSRISLSELGSAAEFAALEQADLAVELLPLLRGQLSVDRVHASGVRVAVTRDSKGRRNIDDLMQPAPVEAKTSSKPIQLEIHSVRLNDVRARFKDEVAGIDGELLLKELNTGRIANQVKSKVQMVIQVGLKSPALKGELRGSCEVTPDFESGSIRLADMDLGYKGDAPNASNIDAVVKGELAYDASKGAVEAKKLAMRISANTGAVKLSGTKLDIARFAHDATNKRFVIGQLKLHVLGTQAGKPLELTLDWPELDVKGDALKGSALSGQFKLAGDLPLDVRFSSGAPGGNFEQIRIPSFEARLSGLSGPRKIEGTLRSDVVLQIGTQALALDKLGLDLKLDDPALKPLALTLQGQASASALLARWNLTGQFNGNGFSTDGSANLAHTTPSIKANARFETLDLNTVVPAATPSGSTAPTTDIPIDLAPLRLVNGSFTMRAASLALRQYRLSDVLLDATLDSGVLRVSALQAKIWGGSVEAMGIADARASRIALKAAANAVNINSLLKDVAGKDAMEGKGRVVADIDTAGRSVSEMKSRLKGNVALQLRDGAVKGFNLAKSLRQAKAALSVRKDTAQRASQTDKTDFSEMNASFQIDAGVARSHDLDMKSPYLRLAGEGSLDVGKGRIDYTARTTVTDTSKGQDGADLAALKGLTIPVKLSGPFDAMDWNIQWSAVAAGAVKNQLEGKLKDKLGLPGSGASAPTAADMLKDKAKDKVKDKLKGLFQ